MTTETFSGRVLALDAGQSGIRTELHEPAGDASLPPALEAHEFPGIRTDQPLFPQLARVAREALGDGSAGAQVLAIGCSGLTDDATAEPLLELVAGTGITEVRLAHDSTTSYLGALGDVNGVVVAAGTGVVTLAVGEHRVARVDGWGYLIGDAGSGYWIGRAALDAVMRAHDGRGPATALTARAEVAFDDLEGAYVELQSDELKVSRIAAWARTVAELADDDLVCRRISIAAGQELAHSALTGLRQVGEDGAGEDAAAEPRVSMLGKVFASAHVRAAFERAVADELPAARIVAPRGPGIEGAARLALVSPASPLGGRIRIAGTNRA